MKTLRLLLIVVVLGGACYFFVAKDSPPGERKAVFKAAPEVPAVPKGDPVTGDPLVDCPNCHGSGLTKCSRCKDGTVDCNGPCLRLNKGLWLRKVVAGHPSTDVWQEFSYKRGRIYLSQGYVGRVVEMVDGVPTIVGVCKICDGTTRMPCPVCHEAGKVACPVCLGQKQIPESRVSAWKKDEIAEVAVIAPPPAPRATPRPQILWLKDGKSIKGRIVIRDAEMMTIRMENGKSVQVPTENLVP